MQRERRLSPMSETTNTSADLSPGPAEHAEFPSLGTVIHQILSPLASLKLTVVLFALSIFLVLAGTLAQVDKDIWDVVHHYFRCWVTWIPVNIFFPPSFFPYTPDKAPNI